MLTKVKKPLTDEEALGEQNRGAPVPFLTGQQKKILHEFRHDEKGLSGRSLADEGLGLQFTPDPTEPWLNPNWIKLNLGTYRNFTTTGWINIASPGDAKRDFNLDYMSLWRVTPESFHFIYAPYILDEVDNPPAFLRLLRDLTKRGGVVGVVIENRDELIRLGRRFDKARFNTAELKRLLYATGFKEMGEIDFRVFDLAGGDPANTGFFAQRSA